MRVWALPYEIACEIVDHGGLLIDPLAGFVPPDADVVGGLGLWLARQLSRWFVIDRDPSGGTAVRFGVLRA